MDFIPNKDSTPEVPYFDDARSEDGWQGQATTKSIQVLQDEVSLAIRRLGGTVTRFQPGTFLVDKQRREGYQMLYVIEAPDGSLRQGRLNIAALPVKESYRLQKTLKTRKEKSLKMALYMLRNALEGTWFLQQLSPGFSILMPGMLLEDGQTVTEKWSRSVFNRLLPEGGEFVEGEYSVVDATERLVEKTRALVEHLIKSGQYTGDEAIIQEVRIVMMGKIEHG